ncbi:MAG: hypothetical protein KF912_00365 [Phycisphaeraceae bacterium]|nr:hypothetical protein [Phycisphaeraceae bacterium]
MKGSRRSPRPYTRPAASRRSADRDVSRLSGIAGLASLERLEPRQLLFSMTITPSDLVSGDIGEVRAQFGYTIPILQTGEELQINPPDDFDEDFNDERGDGVAVQPIASGTIFNGSGLRVTHNISVGARFAVRERLGYLAQGPGPAFTQPIQEIALEANMVAGEQFTYTFRGQGTNTTNIGVQSMTMEVYGVGNNVGLDSARMRVDLFFRGQVVASYTGAQLRALNQTNPALPGIGTFNFTTQNNATPVFDSIRFNASGPVLFAMDNVNYTIPAGNFSDIVSSRIFGAEVVFSGPIGSTVRFLDLYGRDIVQTIQLGAPQGLTVPLVDLDDNGIPNFNDGIGRIELSGGDVRTSLTIVGFRIQQGVVSLLENRAGYFSEFEDAGFGFVTTPDGVIGLPDAPGSVIIGSPWVRPLNNYNPVGLPPGSGGFIDSGFTNPEQGIFVTDGSSMGSVAIHGVVFGSSQFTGALDTLAITYPLGTFSVQGDLGRFVAATDAGLWVPDPGADLSGFNDLDLITKTNSSLIVGRTLGEFTVAGRSLMEVSVLGDLSSPQTRPMIDSLRYRELEVAQGILIAATEFASIRAHVNRTSVNAITGGTGQALFYGNGFYRNDTIIGAEIVNRQGTSVIISGNVGLMDPINTNEDAADVYGFLVDGRNDVRVEISNIAGEYVRIVDVDGRMLAANSISTRTSKQSVFTFSPNAPGLYYLVVLSPGVVDGSETSGVNYEVTLSGLAPVTFGGLRTGGSLGQDNVRNGLGNDVNIQVLNGSLGAIRVGTGIRTSAGADADPTDYINSDVTDVQALMTWGGGTVSVQGNLYNITTGSDLNIEFEGLRQDVINVFIGGDFGNLVTGIATAAGAGANDGLEGDLGNLNMTVGGRVGVIDVRGSIGIDRDSAPSATTGSQFVLRTGVNGGDGSIGMIRVGGHIYGPSISVRTPAGSIIGGILVSQDVQDTPNTFYGIWGGFGGGFSSLNTGFGSDVRFVDSPQVAVNSVNTTLPIIGGQVLELIDDGGAKVTFSVAGAPNGVPVGLVRFLPVDGSQGVAIAEVQVDLSGPGQRLDIQSDGRTGTPVSIGRITLTNTVATSSIRIVGSGEVDIWRIVQTGGDAFERIINDTPNGDIVAMDVLGISFVEFGSGDIGRTEVIEFGPKLIGPFLGLASGLNQTVGGPLGIVRETMAGDWGGGIFRPTQNASNAAGAAFLDDVGSPFDGYLNGIVVRDGNVTEIRTNGAVGDVILQGATSELVRLVANLDGVTPIGRFEGIVGTVFANIISRVEIGDGLLQRADSPLSTTGIFATNEVRTVIGDRIAGSIISSTITASNQTAGEPGEVGGISLIELTNGGRIIDAYISVSNMDNFWTSILYGADNIARGQAQDILTRNADIFRTEMFFGDLNRLQVLGGVFDAVFIQANGNINLITADEYRNSTLSGTALELFPNAVIVDGNLNEFRVNGSTTNATTLLGTVKDITIDVVGNLNLYSASDTVRVILDVDGIVRDFQTARMRASNINAGELTRLAATETIVSSSIAISGPIVSLTAGDSIINTTISVTGPRGRMDLVSAVNLISGQISSAGPIGTIRTTVGDIKSRITTITAFGSISLLSAGRDLDITGDVSAGVTTLVAGRHIGNISKPGVVLIRGNLGSATAGGTLYNDIRVGQSITGTVTTGAVSAKPGANLVGNGSIIAFGRINSVVANGDFGGSIVSWSGGIGTVTISNGSFYKGRTIASYDGSIDSLVINSGHLLGNVHADWNITSLRVVASADGIFGDVGINPANSAFRSYDARRNELPPGVAATTGVDGPRITAGHNIVSFEVTNGSIFEAFIHAGRSILAMQVNGGVANNGGTTERATVIAAGDQIGNITFTGGVNRAFFGAGIVSFGADNLPGGTGANADVVRSGTINGITASALDTVDFVAGVNAGADGLYIGGDDRTAVGLSSASNIIVSGPVTNARLTADSLAGGIDGRIFRASTTRPTTDPDILAPGEAQPGVVVPGSGLTVNIGGVSTRISFSGPGSVRWDASTRTVTFSGTTSATILRVDPAGGGSVANLNIVGRDDISIGSIVVTGSLTGNSNIKVDGNAGVINVATFNSTGRIIVGGTLSSLISGDFFGGHVEARTITATNISGFFGNTSPGIVGEASIIALDIGTVNVGKTFLGLLSSDRSITSIVIGGSINVGFVRAGDTIGSLTAASLSRAWISARDAINSVTIAGDMFDSSIMSGIDLGADGRFGGTGVNADLITTGRIGTITIGGNFAESDIVAGIYRGNDGFFGNNDDLVAEGRSTIGSITIGGSQVGSNVNSESYAISSTGTIGTVRIAGQNARNQGNFRFGPITLNPEPIQVTDLRVDEASRVYSANLTFNMPLDVSTLSRALSVSEVRGTGSVTIRLIEGLDYTLTYNPTTRVATVTFARAVTERNLPQVVGVPGAGAYRFELDQNILRASLVNARLDGDGNGFAEAGDNYSEDDFVGDAGDKLTSQRSTIVNTFGNSILDIDFYGPFNLDIVMDNNRASDGLADANRKYTVRGSIGDHPDTNINFFKPAGDVDLYRVSLQAGQILRLGQMQGSALLAGRSIVDPNGAILGEGQTSAALLALPVNGRTEFDFVGEFAYLVKQTGVYVIAIGNTNAFSNATVPNIDSIPGAVGTYRFDIEIFDDGDSGFNASTNAGDGNAVVYAPSALDFAGPDRIFGTADDLTTRIIGSYTFVYNAGPDGIKGTADDFVLGTSPDGITSNFTTAVINGVNTAVRTVTISSAIGPTGHSGVPSDVWADVDIYHLNNRQAIAPGTRLKITVKLADLGADLGSRNQRSISDIFLLSTFFDYRGFVQFGVFDTTNSVGIDDGVLLFSPTDFTGREGRTGVIADNGTNSYGFDANGDFYIDFVTPGALGSDGTVPAKYAVYLQGAFNTDYQIEIVQFGGTVAAAPRLVQNILLETRGGSVNWLEAGGLTTTLTGFDSRVLGYAGNVADGRTIDKFLLDSIISQLTGAYAAVGVDIRISANPADFEFQDFSTVFLTSDFDSLNFVNSGFSFFGIGTITNQPFGYSQRSDALNISARDESVVFIPSASSLGYTQSQAELEQLSQSLTAAVGRRVGEMLGLRISNNFTTSADADIMASNSVQNIPGLAQPYRYSNANRLLSSSIDPIDNTNFFLGRQRAVSLLDRILASD